MFSSKGFGVIKLILLVFLAMVVALGVYSYNWYKNLTPEKLLNNKMVQNIISLPESDKYLYDLVPKFLGFTKPMTYLILFENNTELRPGGGFIGVYSLISVDKGKVEIKKVDGTENLDRNAPVDFKIDPPKPIYDHLKVDRWFFRDSNWSPDFGVDGQRAIDFYRQESSDETPIDGVVAITPTVIENVMKITGPITVNNITFTAENVTEKLEYEVEYGYDDKGIIFAERKQIISPFMLLLMDKVKSTIFFNIKDYLNLFNKMATEKQVLVYVTDQDLQKEMENKKWAGKVVEVNGDYLMWVDANLAALKTDWIMQRNLHYSFSPDVSGRMLAKAEMEYIHKGKFDWRTTRYLTYARIYVPLGSELKLVEGVKVGEIADEGEELGKKWFGIFTSIEPGKTKTLSFSYLLPEKISEQLRNNNYSLLIQKQAGTILPGLTLDLNFGKTIKTATPAEEQKEWGDVNYKYQSDLGEDREFVINF